MPKSRPRCAAAPVPVQAPDRREEQQQAGPSAGAVGDAAFLVPSCLDVEGLDVDQWALSEDAEEAQLLDQLLL